MCDDLRDQRDLPGFEHRLHPFGGHLEKHPAANGPEHDAAELEQDLLSYGYLVDPDEGCDEIPARPAMRITQSAYQECMAVLAAEAFTRERAAMLIGPPADDLVTHFILDKNGLGTPASFTLDVDGLNAFLRRYRQAGLGMSCKGLIHTHPAGVMAPSGGDIYYVRQVFGNPKNDAGHIYMPIVCNGRLYPYVLTRTEVRSAELILI